MPDTQQLAESMLAAAGAVLGRLVEQSASPSPRRETITTDRFEPTATS